MINVLYPGMLTTIQDLGRFGFQKYGVIVSGAMDAYALRIANLLVGNDENSPALEMTLLGPTLEFTQDCLISITGLGMTGSVGDQVVPAWRPVYIRARSILEFKPGTVGCRAYLAVQGGFSIPKVMNSSSTYLKAGIGGYHGRALRKNDVLMWNQPSVPPFSIKENLVKRSKDCPFAYPTWSISPDLWPQYQVHPVLRVLPGNQFADFTEESRALFFERTFEVSSRSDRMGYRLSGWALELTHKFDLISEAVTSGTVQVPPDGNPIILLADRQTMGGYAKIAQVTSADLPVIAQVRPGERVGFELVSLEHAQQLLREQEAHIKYLKAVLKHWFER